MNNLRTNFVVGRIPFENKHPRPQFRREEYKLLNGAWDYVILNRLQDSLEDFKYEGKIIVPFAVETLLSNVGRKLTEKDTLVYRRFFDKPFSKGRTILHFDAVDYRAIVFLNGEEIYENFGGYFNFSIDITKALKNQNELIVLVQDPSDKGKQQRGKQSLNPGGIWYTPTSGIWQSVWLENVPDTYIDSIKLLPDVDNKLINIKVHTNNPVKQGEIELYFNNKLLTKHKGNISEIELRIADIKLWTPETPDLYDIIIRVGDDEVKSYFAMRKFELRKDKFYLNNKPYFLTGLLDQGYWPDGGLTAPNDEALKYDIEIAKSLGFNVLRKHIKIEPHRWYYYCDKLGMIVWQDMINGGGQWSFMYHGVLPTLKINVKDSKYKIFGRNNETNRKEFKIDLTRMVDQLYNYPSICLWGIFNEAWGQFDSQDMLEFLTRLDNSRAIDATSGWYNQGNNLLSVHRYILPFKMAKVDKAVALTEFGGYSLPIDNHISCEKQFGYLTYKDRDSYNKALERLYYKQIVPAVKNGLAACIYTQLSDVEEEINGLVTYDRKVLKVDKELMIRINKELLFSSNF